MIDSVLRQPTRKKPLSFIIKTIHSETVCERTTSSALQLATFPQRTGSIAWSFDSTARI
jgi:hypothetical protein